MPSWSYPSPYSFDKVQPGSPSLNYPGSDSELAQPAASGSGWFTPALLYGASQSAKDITAAMNAKANRKQQAQLTQAELDARKQESQLGVASRESMADPFRQQLQQAGAAGQLDKAAHATFTPVTFTPPGKYAQYMPTRTGGYSYQKSPAFVQAAKTLEANVLAGKTAPTMTDPLNYGKTAAVAMDANGNPIAAGQPGGPNSNLLPPSEFLSRLSFAQRGGGGGPGAVGGAAMGAASGAASGAAGGPIGAAIGAGAGALSGGLGGLINKHAASATSDYAVNDARDAIGRAFQYYQGKQPTQQQIEQAIKSQGWKSGDRWVGSAGLLSVLANIQAGNSYS